MHPSSAHFACSHSGPTARLRASRCSAYVGLWLAVLFIVGGVSGMDCFDPASQAEHLDRDMLDAVSNTQPTWTISYAPHIVYVNSPMLKLIGVDDQSVRHGLGRYPDGRLYGWVSQLCCSRLSQWPMYPCVWRRQGAGHCPSRARHAWWQRCIGRISCDSPLHESRSR